MTMTTTTMTTVSLQGAVRRGRHMTTTLSLTLHVLLSLLTHLAELTLTSLLAITVYRDPARRDLFFALTAGLTILPLVTLQLLSAIFLLRSHGDSMTGRESATGAGVHVLQLGFIWRHVALLLPLKPQRDASHKRRDLKELLLLRLVFALTGGFPLLLLQTYLLLLDTQVEEEEGESLWCWSWLLPASLSVGGFSCAWSVASFHSSAGQECGIGGKGGRRGGEERGGGGGRGGGGAGGRGGEEQERGGGAAGGGGGLLSWWWWRSLVVAVVWRGGEAVSRVSSLTLFACLYGQWIFGVLGLHWVLVILCFLLPKSSPLTTTTTTSSSRVGKVLSGLLRSYSFLWCFFFVSACGVSGAVWCALYYVMVFLENGALCVLWLMQAEAEGFVYRPPGEESGSDARSPRYRSPAGASCVLPGCMDLGHPSRSPSICTLTTNTTTLRPGDEERSLDTAVDLLPGWLTSQGVGLKYARDPRPIPHTQHTAQQALRSPSSMHPRQPHIMTPRNYRPVPTQAAAARGRVSSSHSDGYSTDHTVLEWSKLPVTPLAANVWSIQDTTDTDCCCCRRCYLSAAESEAASMDPAPHPARGKGCQACLGSAGDVVYGIPREVLRLPDKGPTTAGVSSPPELQMPCSSCRLYQQRRPDHGRHSSVFTIPSRRDGCCGSDTCGYYVNASCLACSSDGSAHEVLRKNKQQSHRRRRRHQTSRASIRNGHLLSVGSSTFSSMETIETGSVSEIEKSLSFFKLTFHHHYHHHRHNNHHHHHHHHQHLEVNNN
ncbi:uncharacterized protein LOC143280350 [Babylonia areolata]|uniref:uncharacterized protein LOC143280350 n=1 Tax=Babylonia areolata TaxID=304850 RepID=UPI003FD2FABA